MAAHDLYTYNYYSRVFFPRANHYYYYRRYYLCTRKLCLYFVGWVIVWRVYNIKGTTSIHAFIIIIYRRQRVCVICRLFVGKSGGKLMMIPVCTM